MNFSLEPGEIIFTDFLFSNFDGSKRRPALVISNRINNAKNDDIVVLKITSQNKDSEFMLEIKPKDLIEGQLKKQSFIKTDFLYTVEKTKVFGEKGKLSKEKLNEVKEKLRKLFEL